MHLWAWQHARYPKGNGSAQGKYLENTNPPFSVQVEQLEPHWRLHCPALPPKLVVATARTLGSPVQLTPEKFHMESGSELAQSSNAHFPEMGSWSSPRAMQQNKLADPSER